MRLILLISLLFLPVTAYAASDVGLWTEMVGWIRMQQQQFHRELAGAIRAVQSGGVTALWGLISLSFLYGVFHAAGPGHGKAVISAYLLTHEDRLKRAIILSFGASFVQGLSAIILVEGLMRLLGWAARDTQVISGYVEQVSYGLVMLIGLVLCYRVGRVYLKKRISSHEHHHHHHHADHNHSHDHDEEGACSVCGHSHGLSAEDINQANSWRDSLAIIFSVGIRPCSGSVLVLVFANIIHMPFLGIAAVCAISFGTALAVSGLGVLTVFFRKGALKIVDKTAHQAFETISLGVGFMGGLIVALMGLSLLSQSMQTSHPLF